MIDLDASFKTNDLTRIRPPSHQSQPESPSPISPLKSRFQHLTLISSSKHVQKSPTHLQVPVNAELIKLKESSSNGKIIRKRITSKISQHRLNVNPSTIMSMNSLEQSSTIQPMKTPIGIDSVTPTLEMEEPPDSAEIRQKMS